MRLIKTLNTFYLNLINSATFCKETHFVLSKLYKEKTTSELSRTNQLLQKHVHNVNYTFQEDKYKFNRSKTYCYKFKCANFFNHQYEG